MALYVSIDAVLVELNQDPSTVTALQRAKVEQRIQGAQSKVLAHLGRDRFEAQTIVTPGLWFDTRYQPTDPDAWPDAPMFNDTARYIAHMPNADDPDLYDVTWHVGLDLGTDSTLQPIKDWILFDAAESLVGDPLFPTAPARVTSISAGGQSISYDKRPGAPGVAAANGAPITLEDLNRWRRINIGGPSTPTPAPWPYARSLR